MTVREMRLGRGWSQEQLAELSSLSVRTIQRIENGHVPGLASAAALAAVFDVDADVLRTAPAPEPPARTFFDAIRVCLRKYATFAGGAERTEYWWFMLFVVLVGAVATLGSETLGAIVLLLLALPLLAAGSRRLHDTGHSGWWQLLALVPFGAVVPLVMLAMPTL